jgi:hypothetical protein
MRSEAFSRQNTLRCERSQKMVPTTAHLPCCRRLAASHASDTLCLGSRMPCLRTTTPRWSAPAEKGQRDCQCYSFHPRMSKSKRFHCDVGNASSQETNELPINQISTEYSASAGTGLIVFENVKVFFGTFVVSRVFICLFGPGSTFVRTRHAILYHVF